VLLKDTIDKGGTKMNITDIKIRKIFPDGKIRAIVSIIIDGDFAVHDLKIIEGVERLFIAMPNRRSDDGRFQDIVHPITSEAREQIETLILEKYSQLISKNETETETEIKTETETET
jgi:stage V sporulation protein G